MNLNCKIWIFNCSPLLNKKRANFKTVVKIWKSTVKTTMKIRKNRQLGIGHERTVLFGRIFGLLFGRTIRWGGLFGRIVPPHIQANYTRKLTQKAVYLIFYLAQRRNWSVLIFHFAFSAANLNNLKFSVLTQKSSGFANIFDFRF